MNKVRFGGGGRCAAGPIFSPLPFFFKSEERGKERKYTYLMTVVQFDTIRFTQL
jgi:hypothetical protein